jgi:diacylglycerol O-acyltransferase
MQRMSGIDPMFVYSDTPLTPMEVAYICVFDPTTAPAGGYTFDAVRSMLAERVPTLLALRRRLMRVPFGIDHPRWVDDPAFDLDNHLHRVALPAPGGEVELRAKAAEVMGRPLNLHQPPWEMHVVEGLADGRIGLIAKVHHSVIDGVAGVQLMAQLLDFAPEGRPADAAGETAGGGDGGAAVGADGDGSGGTNDADGPGGGTRWRAPSLPSSLPSGVQLLAHAIPNLVTSPLRALGALREIGKTAVRMAQRALDEETPPLSIPLGAPATFETPVGAARSVAFAELGLAQVRDLKERFGVSINDVILAVCSGALRTHLAAHEQLAGSEQEAGSPLVAVVPISVRSDSPDDLGNRLSAMFVPLANDLAEPLDRLRSIAAACATAKAQERAVGYGPMASALSEAVPPALARPVIQLGISMGALRRARAGNLMISNVPGPDFALYFAGMKMLAAYPLGPVVDGVALNITVQSYNDTMFVGLNACASAVPDLPALAVSIAQELGRITAAAENAYDTMGSIERRARTAKMARLAS